MYTAEIHVHFMTKSQALFWKNIKWENLAGVCLDFLHACKGLSLHVLF